MATGTTKQNLNLRNDPSTTNPPLQTIPKGTTIQILGNANVPDWLQVQAPDGTKGYVLGSFLDIQADAPAQPAALPADAAAQPAAQPAPSDPAPAAQTAPADPAPVDPVPTTQPVAAQAEPTPAPADPAPVAQPAAPVSVSSSVPAKLLTPTGATLNVRSGPATTNSAVEQVISGALLTPLEDDATVAAKVGSSKDQNQWIQVKTPSGQTGYVAAWLVAFQGSVPSDGTGITDINSYINSIPAGDYPMPQGYRDFWAQKEKLGLPDPFDVSPTQVGYPACGRMMVNGFGPNTFSYENWQSYYKNVCGMHNGLDHIIPLGTPLLAVADGVIVGTQANWQFLGNPNDKSIILWPFLPEQYKDAKGRRMMSNVLVAYGHMSDNSTVQRHQVVKAGQLIGMSGRPFGETANDHLHLEVHLLTGDAHLPRNTTRRSLADYSGTQYFSNVSPFNPLLFFSERMVRYHMHQGKKIGYGGGPTYPTATTLGGDYNWPALDMFSVAQFQYGNPVIWTTKSTPWAPGVFDLPTLINRIANYTSFQPYAADFLG